MGEEETEVTDGSCCVLLPAGILLLLQTPRCVRVYVCAASFSPPHVVNVAIESRKRLAARLKSRVYMLNTAS